MNKTYFVILLFIMIFTNCVKEHQFGKSNINEIFFFNLSQQVGSAEINKDSLTIKIKVSAQANISSLYLDSVYLSSYSTISPGIKTIMDFTNPVNYTLTAENGSKKVYVVTVTKEIETPQLENNLLDNWYTPLNKNYLEPGKNEATIWATGNAGVVTLGSANVNPVTISGNDLAAELTTKDLGSLGQLVGQRIAAGSIFTGNFILDISNPLNSTKFGIGYTARPKSITLDYSYLPGSPYRNGKGQILSKVDSCDIYLLLENKSSSQTKRIATGWFRSGKQIVKITELTIPLIYGTLPSGTASYMFPSNNLFGNSSDNITSLTFVASSSANGALFEGGVNSKLTINNIILNY